MGAGAVTGAILGGPGGALAGTIIGASVITVHLLISHPQATLENGTVLLFTLSEPLNLAPGHRTGESARPARRGRSGRLDGQLTIRISTWRVRPRFAGGAPLRIYTAN